MINIDDFKESFDIVEIKPNTYQVYLPIFFKDGDMVKIIVKEDNGKYTINDNGYTINKLFNDFDAIPAVTYGYTIYGYSNINYLMELKEEYIFMVENVDEFDLVSVIFQFAINLVRFENE